MLYESNMKLKPTTAGTASYRNHLSCWRSSPHARCSRTKSENSAARMLVNSKASPTRVVASNNSYVVIPPPMTPRLRTGSEPNCGQTELPDRRHRQVSSTPLRTPPSTPRFANEETVDAHRGTAASRRLPPGLAPRNLSTLRTSPQIGRAHV